MILASAVRQVRGHGDNKFEVVTSLRTFIFRAEREGIASEFCHLLAAHSVLSACQSASCRSDRLIPCLALFFLFCSSLIPLRPPPTSHLSHSYLALSKWLLP